MYLLRASSVLVRETASASTHHSIALRQCASVCANDKKHTHTRTHWLSFDRAAWMKRYRARGDWVVTERVSGSQLARMCVCVCIRTPNLRADKVCSIRFDDPRLWAVWCVVIFANVCVSSRDQLNHNKAAWMCDTRFVQYQNLFELFAHRCEMRKRRIKEETDDLDSIKKKRSARQMFSHEFLVVFFSSTRRVSHERVVYFVLSALNTCVCRIQCTANPIGLALHTHQFDCVAYVFASNLKSIYVINVCQAARTRRTIDFVIHSPAERAIRCMMPNTDRCRDGRTFIAMRSKVLCFSFKIQLLIASHHIEILYQNRLQTILQTEEQKSNITI